MILRVAMIMLYLCECLDFYTNIGFISYFKPYDIKRDPFDKNGLGKPEKLKENFSSYFSRRITAEHRLVYKIIDGLIIVAQCRYHY